MDSALFAPGASPDRTPPHAPAVPGAVTDELAHTSYGGDIRLGYEEFERDFGPDALSKAFTVPVGKYLGEALRASVSRVPAP